MLNVDPKYFDFSTCCRDVQVCSRTVGRPCGVVLIRKLLGPTMTLTVQRRPPVADVNVAEAKEEFR